MGRYVRAVLRELTRRPPIDLTLLVRDVRAAAAYRDIVGPGIAIAPLAAARSRRAFDRVWYPWNGVRFAAAAPAVVTINDDFAFTYPARGFIARQREQAPIRRAVRRAAGIVTISHWSRDTLIERFALPPAAISVIPLGPDAFFFPGRETSPYGTPFVLAVGAGEARKNIGFLVDVFARAFPRGDVRLVVVGEPGTALRARIAAAALPVDLPERIDDDALRRLYRTAAVVAVPSLAEGFGLVAAEALACGAVVVAANASALPEAVGDAGLLIDPHDGPAWISALRQLVSDPAAAAVYRARAARWKGASADRTTESLVAALERAVDDRV